MEAAPDQLVAEGFVAFRQGRDEEAQKLFERSAELARESGNGQCWRSRSAALRGERAEAARLLAAAKAAFDRAGASIDPGSAEEYEEARAGLGDDFATEWAEGSELSLAEAVARARRARPA